MNLKRISGSKINSLLNRKVSLEGKILLVVYFADGVFTAFLVKLGLAVELNPVMRLLLEHGIPTFVAAKIAIVAAFIVALEVLRRPGKIARLIRLSQWVAIITLPLAILLVNLLLTYPRILWSPG